MGDFDHLLGEFDLAETSRIDCGKFAIIVRPMNLANQDYRKAVLESSRTTNKLSVVSEPGEVQTDDDQIRVFCNAVIVGWENVKNKDGKEIKFTPGAAFKMLSGSNAGKVLYSRLVLAATDDQTFRVALEKN